MNRFANVLVLHVHLDVELFVAQLVAVRTLEALFNRQTVVLDVSIQAAPCGVALWAIGAFVALFWAGDRLRSLGAPLNKAIRLVVAGKRREN